MAKLGIAYKLKASLIDYLLDKFGEEIIIGSEIMFARKRALADLVVLHNQLVHAYEIKSPNDDFRRLPLQIIEYNKVFDYVSVVTTEKHLQRAIELTPVYNGIYLITNNDTVEVYRHPILNQSKSKEEILASLTIKFLVEHFKIHYPKSNSAEIRRSLLAHDIVELSNALCRFLNDRTAVKYTTFLKERGKATHYEDISLLSMPLKKITFHR